MGEGLKIQKNLCALSIRRMKPSRKQCDMPKAIQEYVPEDKDKRKVPQSQATDRKMYL